MKKTGIVTLALISGLLSAGTFQADLSGATLHFAGIKAKGEKNGMEAVKVIDVKDKKLPQLVWNVKDSPRVHLHLKNEMILNNYSSLVFKLKLDISQAGPVYAINLRLRDKDGEFLQYRQPVQLQKDGIVEVEIPIDRKHFHISLGGKQSNEIADQPVRLYEIAFDYTRKASPDIKITILSLTAETVDKK